MWLTFESSGRWAPKLFCPSWPPCWWPHAPLPWLKQCPAAPTGCCHVRMWGAKTGCCRAQKWQQGAKTREPDSNLDNASAQDLSMETSVKRGWIFLWHRWHDMDIIKDHWKIAIFESNDFYGKPTDYTVFCHRLFFGLNFVKLSFPNCKTKVKIGIFQGKHVWWIYEVDQLFLLLCTFWK